jgi:hypothetical protein
MALTLRTLTDIATAANMQINKAVTKTGVVVWSRNTPFYVMQNGKWKIPQPEGWQYYWQCESGANNEGNGYGVYENGVDNNTEGSSSWSSQTFSANGLSNIRIVVSTVADNGPVNSKVYVRGTSLSDGNITSVGTYTGTITDDTIQIALWSEKGDYVYLDEIYIY